MADVKLMRAQIRNVLQDDKDKLLTKELYDTAFKQVQGEIQLRLNAIEKHVKEVLGELDARQKDMQSFLVREATRGNAPVEQTNTPAAEDKKTE